VMCPIGFMHGDLRLDFLKFACKISSLACGSAENRMSGCVAIAPSVAGLESTLAASLKPFISWRGPLKENSRLWLGQEGRFVVDL
jgi:hypothetical protein